MDYVSVFVERIKELIEDKKVTNQEFAKIAGCGHGSVSRWSKGENLPSFRNIVRISEHFEYSIDYLLGKKNTTDYKDFTLISDFPSRLGDLAESRGKTLHGVAKDLEMDDTILYRWGNGKCLPGIIGLLTLAEYFGCTVDYLVGRAF